MSRKGQPYTQEEDDLIRWGYATGADVSLMAKHLGRTVEAIRARASLIKAAPPKPRRSKAPDHKYSAKGPAVSAGPPISTLTGEAKFARLMGNKRFEDVRLKPQKQEIGR
jgi:hypothetical protein